MDALKRKAIKKYKTLIEDLLKGLKPEYRDLLDLISFINLPIGTLDNHDFIAEYLLNKNDTIYLHFSKRC